MQLNWSFLTYVFQKYVKMRTNWEIRNRDICALNCKRHADVEESVDWCKSIFSSKEVESKSHECQRNMLNAVRVTSLEANAGKNTSWETASYKYRQ